ncbi:MAG: SAM-dependent methyltransferase [Clostridia bacterium]|nr:SAM-dependent methyltransferase [Clostridia bacterium]
MAYLRLDERLQTAADLFPACAYGADIGADHGRLSCFLLESGKCDRMCVADISAESLKKADVLFSLRGVRPRADVTVGDGLSVLPQPAGAIAILGMGGHTLAGILEKGREQLQRAVLILSAHTETHVLRRQLAALGYWISVEKIAQAAGRFYVILRAEPGEEAYSEKQIWLGPRLMETKDPHYPAYLAWQMRVNAPKRTQEAARYMQWLKEEAQRVCNSTDD